MRKILSIAAVLAATAIGILATAGTSNAYTVDAAGTHVNKGEVQSAFGWNNGGFDANVVTGNEVTFSNGTLTRTTDNVWSCTNGVGEQHTYRVTVLDQPLNATVLKSSNGKQIKGWDLGGVKAAPYAVVSDTGIPANTATCPAGSSLDFTKPFSINQIGVAKYTTYTSQTGDLKVTIGGVTKTLQDTTVTVPAV